MSENMILQVSVVCQTQSTGEVAQNEASIGPSEVTVFTHDLCLFQSEATKLKLAQQIASIIVKVPEQLGSTIDKVVAYCCSFERLFNSESFVVRVAEVAPYHGGPDFHWDPSAAPSVGSLRHNEHLIYLIKKNNNQYLRLTHFEILNTEIRSLLFRHSYGYDLSLLDFGKLKGLQLK